MILIISYAAEDHSNEVLKHLSELGEDATLIDLADFPAKNDVVLRWNNGAVPSYVVEDGQRHLDLRNVKIAWWRRITPFSPDQQLTDPLKHSFAVSETSQAVIGMLDALPCRWVNHRVADERAQHKPFQWEIAREIGLKLPRTLVTNNSGHAREFITQLGIGNVICKAFLAIPQAWSATRLVNSADMQNLDSIKFAPVIFQEYIKGVDLRITIIGRKIFAAEIDARETSYPYDMRMVVGESTVSPVTLPPALESKLFLLLDKLGLQYGAIDVKRADNGDYYFLEVNPAGQWLFTERLAGLPISKSIAEFLATNNR